MDNFCHARLHPGVVCVLISFTMGDSEPTSPSPQAACLASSPLPPPHKAGLLLGCTLSPATLPPSPKGCATTAASLGMSLGGAWQPAAGDMIFTYWSQLRVNERNVCVEWGGARSWARWKFVSQ